MTVVVVAGAVTVLQFARAADISPWLTAPLLLLGAVAVPSIGAELAVARREEIGLARLRGIHGLRLWRFLLLEPLLAIVLGALVGLALGAVGTVVTTRTWLDEAAEPWGRPALLATAAIAGVGLVIVGLSAAAALREPLAVQVSTRRRPRRATTLAIFLSVLVFVGAGVAAYRSRGADGDPDLVVLVGPALVGLALGQLAIWVIRIAARGLTPATEKRGMGAFLAARRLARADDLVTPIRLVVAAAVVGSLALSGSVSVSGWTDDQARVEVPGARVISADTGAMGALELTERVDPEATHLIATAIVRNDERLAERRAYVDADRWDSVVGGFYDDTPARAASDAVDRLRGDVEPFQVTGSRLTLTASGIDVPPVRSFVGPDGVRETFGGGDGELTLRYVTSGNATGSVAVPFVVPRDGRPVTRSVRVRDCARGCTITGIDVARGADVVFDNRGMTFLVERFVLGDTDLAGRTWVADRSALDSLLNNNFFPGYQPPRTLVVNRPDGLQVALLPSVTMELHLDAGAAVPALVAGESEPQALDLGGDDRATDVIGVARTLPLLGSIGLLTDIRTSAAGSGPTVPSAEVQVVAADGTPRAMLDEVAEATGSSWRTFGSVRASLGERYGGAQSVAYALTALACALVALLALGAGVARHLRDYRRDVASLRVLGISVATARRAGRAELVSLTLLVLGVVVAGGWLAVTLLLGGIPLLANPPAGMPLDTSPHTWPLAVPAVVAAVAVVLVGGRARAVRSATTQPSLLREEEAR
ncbi:ABC transporter permease [Nocardioides sp.]|uniref:ABC transporter permease n=1 Tax=Nocardioides sp. TaxID=35761 RepID=UPI0035AE7379